MNFFKTIHNYLRNKYGLISLSIILSIISVGMLKPDFYLVGWDNFSSYLNLKSTLFNTFFDTWREHRGLGVPSDAEVTDIFRQIFSFVLKPIVGLKIVDQIYMILMLWSGTLGMYVLTKYISKLINFRFSEAFAFFASFFYLFNLSTLSVFYFPMMMYVTRFMMLPTTIFVLFKFIFEKSITKKRLLWYLFLLFVGIGSFMVPTIFVTMVMALGIMFLIFKKDKRLALTLTFYIGINLFWILPFANYTIQKGTIVPNAPTFVEINEAMLNKPKEFFSFERQAKLRPSFFESQFTNNSTNLLTPFHPLALQDELGINRIILWIFPILYLSGIFYVFIFKRNRILIWFGALAMLFLILSMKEFSIFGPIYSFITKNVPFASTVFRFGDTKFHAMIAFSGSILSAYMLTLIMAFNWNLYLNKIKRYLSGAILLLILAVHIFTYRTYFNGNMVGFFMYNIIPDSYFEIANIINDDPESVRVIHLPYDNHTYWKPYSWGYFGSSFFHFMINKSLFDRAFEPASEENSLIHKQIMNILAMAKTVPDKEMLTNRAESLLNLFQELGIKYIIDDGTVSTNIDSRNIAYWGSIDSQNNQAVFEYLKDKSLIKLLKSYEIKSDDYANKYESLYPYNKKTIENKESQFINLYEIKNLKSRIETISEVDIIHSQHTQVLEPQIRATLNDYIQGLQFDARSIIFPFEIESTTHDIKKDSIVLQNPLILSPDTYSSEILPTIKLGKNQHLVKILLIKENQNYKITIKEIGGFSFDEQKNEIDIASSLEFLIDRNYSHILINNLALPIPLTKDGELNDLGSVLIDDDILDMRLLYPYDQFDVSQNLNQQSPSPECFEQNYTNKRSEITGNAGVLIIAGQNVSNCITTRININTSKKEIAYAELSMDVVGEVNNKMHDRKLNLAKPKLNQLVQEFSNPLILYNCIKAIDSSVCLNNENLYRIPKTRNQIVSNLKGNLNDINSYDITLGIRSNQLESYRTKITNIKLTRFSSGAGAKFSLTDNLTDRKYLFKIKNEAPLNLTLPYTQSESSQKIDFVKDGFLIGRDATCDEGNNTHSIKESNQGILSYVAGCKNILNKNIPFSSDGLYLWNVKYKHIAGAAPAFIIMDKTDTHFYTKLFSNLVPTNDAFNIPLQNPENLWSSKEQISEKIKSTQPYSISGYISSQSDIKNFKNKEIIIDHFTQTEGLVEMQEISIVRIPNSFLMTKITPLDYKKLEFNNDFNIVYKRILPSLWKIQLSKKQNNILLHFNEAFDKQWVLIGAKNQHIRCNGFANCFILNQIENENLYILYWPEFLAAVGKILTIITIFLIFLFKNKKVMNSV